MNTPPTPTSNPVTLTTTPNQSIADVVTNPTTSRTVSDKNAATDIIAGAAGDGQWTARPEPRVVSVERERARSRRAGFARMIKDLSCVKGHPHQDKNTHQMDGRAVDIDRRVLVHRRAATSSTSTDGCRPARSTRRSNDRVAAPFVGCRRQCASSSR